MIQTKYLGVTHQEADIPKEVTLNNAETFMVYMARVSNPQSQIAGLSPERLLAYCIRRKHWSVFDMVDVIVEVICPRDISRQLTRHHSFRFQEFSQRYAEVVDFTHRECRLQHATDRQSSILVDANNPISRRWDEMQQEVLSVALKHYKDALAMGVAREQARALLPEGLTLSRLYAKASVRNWIFYLNVRRDKGTQKEHREVAEQVWSIFKEHLPTTAAAVESLGVL